MKFYGKLMVVLISSVIVNNVSAKQVLLHRENCHPIFLFRAHTPQSRNQIDNKTEKILSMAMKKGYFTFVLAKLQTFDLPLELAFIPLIESEYKTNAISPKGAGGLWQLMPKTSLALGIKPCERFDLNASTVAALNH